VDLIAAHWVGVAAVVCLVAALAQALHSARLSRARDFRGDPAGAGATAASSGSRP
jgi:hypothetical protein